ncbi:uncharacterized protein [Procambarus clarkii]|uniref:uncharacterized protein n=1 Tax=Procambarus clarkii TaxID=6728 RepID=UPI00374423C9
MMELTGVPPRNDPGLKLLLPLYHFLQNTCLKAAFKILVEGFPKAQYIIDNLNVHVKPTMKLLDLLYQIHKRVKTSGKCQKRKGKGAYGSNVQPPEKSLACRRSQQITNIEENAHILSQVTVEDLLNADCEKCKKLLDLDLMFVLNMIINDTVQYALDYSVLEAIVKVKDIRKTIFHPQFSFSENDFDQNLKGLVDAMRTLYSHLGYSEQQLQHEEKACRQKAKCAGDIAPAIIDELRCEIHKKYANTQGFILPNISNSQDPSEPVIEDLEQFIRNESSKIEEKLPILLCGNRGTGKSLILKNLAFLFGCTRVGVDSTFCLVLYLDDWDKGAEAEFWTQIFKCVTCLAPIAVSKYGFDSIKAVIGMYIDNILFLINWDNNVVGPIRKEMQRGTWVITYHGSHSPSVDWQILKVKPYEKMQVQEILRSENSKHTEDVIRLYNSCEYKDILTSIDMIKIFSELKSSVTIGTEFEIAESYVAKQICSSVEDLEVKLIKLGKVAFGTICQGKSVFKESDANQIPSEIKERFLGPHGCGLTFIHLIVQDFIAAKYVISDPSIACLQWLKRVHSFKRVFKFACSLWCKDRDQLKENLHYVKEYLIHLFNIKELIEENKTKKTQDCMFVNPMKDPFTHWQFIVQLDNACDGRREILELLASLLSHIPCWSFNTDQYLDNGKIKRIEKILNKVKLSEDSPVLIRLESSKDMSMLIKLWNKIKNIQSIYNCCSVKIVVNYNSSISLVHPKSVSEFFSVITKAHSPVYITEYTGPLLCSSIPELQCKCIEKLKRVNVTVYDVNSLRKLLSCKGLSSLRDVFVRVDIINYEKDVSYRKTEVAEHINLNLTIKYFNNIQNLLDSFKFPQQLSLSIHDLFIEENFKLDLSVLDSVESLYIRCKPNIEDMKHKSAFSVHEEAMEVDVPFAPSCPIGTLARSNWMFQLAMNLSLPPSLKRLMLRNVEFYNDSNNYLLLNFFKKYNIDRLMILDSLLSLKGVRKIISTYSEGLKDDLETMTKKLRVDRSSSCEVRELIAKNPRLSKEEREERRWKKPTGKEIIITSEVDLCTKCTRFPCVCPPQEGVDSRDTFEDLIYLIEDIYCYDILNFSYTSNIFTIRKNLCGDLRVHCITTMLTDDVASVMGSSDNWLSKLFLTLTLAQNICFDYTNLSYKGVKDVIHHLKTVKKSLDTPEPFSLTIGSTWHPLSSDTLSLSSFIEFVEGETCLEQLKFWCMCTGKCFILRKALSGKIYVDDKLIKENG